MNEQREKPILFSAPMVRAILEDRKTQTRRVAKGEYLTRPDPRYCPYGVPGDRLYVKEAAWIWCEKRPNGTTKTGRPKFRYIPTGGHHVVYCADSEKPATRLDDNPAHLWRWKAARFMPRWASRITLEITDVRVQRVQEISEEDARAEGVGRYVMGHGPITDADVNADPGYLMYAQYRPSFQILWDSINEKRGFGWAANPWVWCVSFTRVPQQDQRDRRMAGVQATT